jgi:hypothetical protein
MVMTEWMKSVKEALKTIPKDTPNRLRAAMAKAKLTYKKKGSSAAAAPSHGMKKTHRHRRSGRGRKGSRRHGRGSRKHKGGAMPSLNPADYDGGGGVGVRNGNNA